MAAQAKTEVSQQKPRHRYKRRMSVAVEGSRCYIYYYEISGDDVSEVYTTSFSLEEAYAIFSRATVLVKNALDKRSKL